MNLTVVLFCVIAGVILCCKGVQDVAKQKDTLSVVFGWIYLVSSAAILFYGYKVGLSYGY